MVMSVWFALLLVPSCVGLVAPRAAARARSGVAARSSQGFREPAPLDVATESGARSALAAGFATECVIAVRVLLSATKAGDPVATRHPMLGLLDKLRPDSALCTLII